MVRHLSYVTLWSLPEWSTGPVGDPHSVAAAIAAAGYEGVQAYLPDQIKPLQEAGLAVSAVGRVDRADQLEGWLGTWADAGVEALTIHLGTGFESRDEGLALTEAFLTSATSVRVTVETHRATLFQDPARVLDLVQNFPELRFTADLSHWYTGGEMTYGGFDWKLARIGPVLERVRMIHGRISDPGCIQVVVDPSAYDPHVENFRAMWGQCMRGFLAAGESTVLPFAPELLPPELNYARTYVDPESDKPREVADRWQQAFVLCELAEKLFTEVLEGDSEEKETKP